MADDDWAGHLRLVAASARPAGPMTAPVVALVRRRMRRRRAIALGGAVAATALVVTAGVSLGAGLRPGGDVKPATGQGSLTVDVRLAETAGIAGSATWDAEDQDLVYVTRSGYSSSCLADGAVTQADAGVLRLDIVSGAADGQLCSADARQLLVLVDGLTEPPTELRVVEDGAEVTVPVELSRAGVAPDGQRLVGIGRVAISVPDSWRIGRTRCGQPIADTVFFSARGRECLVGPTAVSAVLLLDSTDRDYADLVAYADRSEVVDGLDVLRGQPGCPVGIACRDRPVAVLSVPAEGVLLVVPHGAGGAAVLDSVRLLPDDLTSVPYVPVGTPTDEAAARYRQAGLEVTVRTLTCADTDSCVNGVGDLEAGTVVPTGTTVTLTDYE